MIINLDQTHFFAILTNNVDIVSPLQEEIPEVLSEKMQCHLISVAKGPE